MANLAQDILIEVINQKLKERRSCLRVDGRFTFVKLCQLSSLPAEEIEIIILTDAGLPTFGAVRHIRAQVPVIAPGLQPQHMYQLPYAPVPAPPPTPVDHFVDAPLQKVNAWNGRQRKTTLQMAELLGDIITTPRHMWTQLQKQVILMSVAGLEEVIFLPGQEEANFNWVRFSDEYNDLAAEDEEFFNAVDPNVQI